AFARLRHDELWVSGAALADRSDSVEEHQSIRGGAGGHQGGAVPKPVQSHHVARVAGPWVVFCNATDAAVPSNSARGLHAPNGARAPAQSKAGGWPTAPSTPGCSEHAARKTARTAHFMGRFYPISCGTCGNIAPPSTTRLAPVMNAAASEARKSTAPTQS